MKTKIINQISISYLESFIEEPELYDLEFEKKKVLNEYNSVISKYETIYLNIEDSLINNIFVLP